MTRTSASFTVTLGALAVLASAQAAEFRATDYGAKGDGRTLDTAAIQRAIDAAAYAAGDLVANAAGHLQPFLLISLGSRRVFDAPVQALRAADWMRACAEDSEAVPRRG